MTNNHQALRATLRDQFDENGFVVVPRFLPSADFVKLTKEIDRYIRDVVPTLGPADAFYHDSSRPETLKQLQHMDADPFFRQYPSHPAWCRLAEDLLGEPCEAMAPEWFNKPPGTEHPTPPHQDNFYFCLKPPSVLTMWLSLDSVDDENGCLRYVAGSHRRGIRPHARTTVLGFSQSVSDYGPEDTHSEVSVHLEPGDLLVHHGETIHRADPNRSPERHRRAFAMVFRGESCRRDDAAFARYQSSLQKQHQAVL